MSDEKLGKKIIDYMSRHRLATLALSRDNQPSAHTVYYVNNGLTLYFESDPITDKVKTIELNPRVSLTIDEDYEDWSKIQGIQLYGNAEFVPKEKEESMVELYLNKYPSIKKLGGIPEHHIFIQIIPDKIYFLDYRKEFGVREILHVEDKSSIIKWG